MSYQGPVNNAAFAKALFPGVNKWWGDTYNQYAKEYEGFTYKVASDKNREEYVGFNGLGLAAIKPEGSPTKFDSMEQGFVQNAPNVTFSLGFVITQEAIEDNKYAEVARARTQELARSARITKETVGANMLNRAFNSSYVFSDGVELISNANLTKNGTTYSNTLVTAADLSETAIEQALIDISKFTDERGKRIMCQGLKLTVPPELMFEACRILDSELQNDTANNAVNAIMQKNLLPRGYDVNHYLTDPDAWFITTDITHTQGKGLIYQERIADSFSNDSEFTTDNAQFKYRGRYTFTAADKRGVFGSPGA